MAGCSEGTLYNHFDNKDDLFLCVLKEQLPNFIAQVMTLRDRVGNGSVQENLATIATAALSFYMHLVPMVASIFSKPTLMARHTEGLAKKNAGPQRGNEALAAYLSAEQEMGRVDRSVDPKAAADLLLGACFQHAFQTQFLSEKESVESMKTFVKGVLDTLLNGILPKEQ